MFPVYRPALMPDPKSTAEVWREEAMESGLGEIVHRTRQRYEPEDQFIFINAWNEWAEGCHLEFDQKYGRSHLEATARGLGLD